MGFEMLYKKISPRLRRLARHYNGHGRYIDEDDLYQEASIYLWDTYGDGMPENVNEAYILKGCEFHILNFLRTQRERALVASLEEPLDEYGNTLRDTIADLSEPLYMRVDRDMVVEDIKKNGCTDREKEVFLLLMEGYTAREAGERLGISHVMVLKHKKNLLKKIGYQKR